MHAGFVTSAAAHASPRESANQTLHKSSDTVRRYGRQRRRAALMRVATRAHGAEP
jgi:hypothetical protein